MSEVVVVPAQPLSARERTLLDRLEADIEQNLKGFKKVGYALTVIRDQQLYRMDFDTFEDYCRETWDIGRPHAYRQIECYKVIENLSPMGDKLDFSQFEILPANERQVRPLTVLAPERQIEVWATVVEQARLEGCRITAALVQECIDAMSQKKIKTVIDKTKKDLDSDDDDGLPDEVQKMTQSFIDLVQRGSESSWKEVEKKRVVKALREILEALED